MLDISPFHKISFTKCSSQRSHRKKH